MVAWKEYAGDFNAMTDAEIERECENARRELDEAESWLEAVASWKDAGKPRKPDTATPPDLMDAAGPL